MFIERNAPPIPEPTAESARLLAHETSVHAGWSERRAASPTRKFRFRTRGLRLGGALALLAFAVWIAIPQWFSVMSSRAIVNANVTALVSPINGALSFDRPFAIGTRIAAGDRIAVVRNENLPSQFARIQGEIEALTRELQVLNKNLRAHRDLLQELAFKGGAYRETYVRRLDTLIDEYKRTLKAEQMGAAQQERDLSRRQELLRKSGSVTVAEVERLQSEFQSSGQRILAREAALRRLVLEREAAIGGTFLADSYNNTPYSDQRADEVRMAIAQVEAQIAGIETRKATLEAERIAERERVDRLGSASIIARTDGFVWELLTSEGEYAREAQRVMKMVSCTGAFVDAAVSQGRIGDLWIGQSARITLAGSGERRDGVVTAIRSTAPSPETLALPSSVLERATGALQVIVAFTDIPEDGGNRLCDIGRQATVEFISR